MPQNNRLIKLHKGSDNKISIRVRNTDLKLVDVRTMVVKAKIVNRQNNEKVLEKYLTMSDSKGIAFLEVFEGDLIDIAAGFYEMVLIHEDSSLTGSSDYFSQSAFYVDENDNISFKVEVTAQGDTIPQPTVELLKKDFMPRISNGLTYETRAVPCNALRNHKNSNHTFALYCKDFSGTVEVYGSLDLSPPITTDQYFLLEIAPGSTKLRFDNHTGLEPFHFSANLVYAKFVIRPDIIINEEQGEISKILWRS